MVEQLRAAKARITRTSRALASRAARLAAATQAQAVTTRALTSARAERASYLAELRRKLELNSLQIAQVQTQAQAAGRVTAEITAHAARPSTTPVTFSSRGRTLTVSATAYSLPGFTASGLPVGWGVVAVDPNVIPLGTHMTIPGYGEAVAADTGSAVKGATIDVWFPTLALASAWGRRSITITLD
jgi:cystine transport system substrate-binding protein